MTRIESVSKFLRELPTEFGSQMCLTPALLGSESILQSQNVSRGFRIDFGDEAKNWSIFGLKLEFLASLDFSKMNQLYYLLLI